MKHTLPGLLLKKQSFGETNNGNTARRTYENAEIIVDITVMLDVMDDYQIEDNPQISALVMS